MLMTHDAATGYAKDGHCSIRTPLNNWAVTQTQGGFLKQLECGARAFDLRPYVKSNGAAVFMHHGDVVFETDIKHSVGEIIKWSESNTNSIIFLMVGHCQGEDDAAQKRCSETGGNSPDAQIEGTGAKYFNCNDLKTMTVGQILTHGKQKNGGSVVYTWAPCVEANWDETIQCYGEGRRLETADMAAAPERRLWFHHITHVINKAGEAARAVHQGATTVVDVGKSLLNTHTCYGSEAEQRQFFDPFWKYFDDTTNKATPPTDKMYVTQAHWQYDGKTVALGTAKRSCIINDEKQSKMNENVAAQIHKGTHKNLFLLQVDNVCNHGPELAAALHSLAEKRLSTLQAKFDDSSLPILAQPHTTSFKAAAAFLLGGLGLVSAALVAVGRGLPGRRSSAAADFATVPSHGEE